jgi:PAS domain S-box-containing protein
VNTLLTQNMVEMLPDGKKKDTLRLHHELEVYKTELEMQNTELGNNRNELETNLARYADLYDSSPAAYFTLARNGAIVELNLTGATLLGIGRSLLIGRNFKLFVPNKERPAFIAFLNRVFSSEVKESYETTLTKEGNPANFVRIEAIADQFLHNCRMVVIDITERKLAEGKFLESEELFSSVFRSSPVGIGISSLADGRFIEINDAFLHTYGYERQEIIGHTSDELILWADPEYRGRVVAMLSEKGSVRNMEMKCRRKSGEIGDLLFSAELVQLGGEICFLGMIIDITERKKVEQELRDSEECYRRLFEMESDAILVVDQEANRFLDANIAAQKMYGYTMEEFLRLTVADISADPEKSRQAINAKQNWVPCRLHRKKDGTIFPVEIASSYFEFKGREIFVDAIRDITERTRADTEIIAYQGELRSMASEISLVEERERHKIATALHDQVGQTLAMASFKLGELRQAVAPGALGAKVDEVREMLTRAIGNSRTLTFELSPPILYDLGLEAAVCSLAERYGKEYGIRIDCRDDSQPKPLSYDMRILLFQGVRELFVNAVKHAHPQRITISCLREGTDIKVVVEDDGVGFATADEEALPGKTRGFGLFSLRERLKYLGGSIAIKSAPGCGAQITLTAPLSTEPDVQRE